MPDWVLLESSNLEAASYNTITNELDIQFKGGSIYRYSDVPESVYQDLLDADSHGKFFHTNIKGMYEFEKLSG